MSYSFANNCCYLGILCDNNSRCWGKYEPVLASYRLPGTSVFSFPLSQRRQQRAVHVLGETVVHRLLCFALYLLGVNRRAIGEALGIPSETAKSIIKAVGKEGLPALEDRRRRVSDFLPQAPVALAPVSLSLTGEHIIVDFGAMDRRLQIPRQNERQARAVLLSLLNNRLLPKDQVAKAIGLSVAHTIALSQRLNNKGIGVLIDKRRGQQSDYRVTPQVKAEVWIKGQTLYTPTGTGPVGARGGLPLVQKHRSTGTSPVVAWG